MSSTVLVPAINIYNDFLVDALTDKTGVSSRSMASGQALNDLMLVSDIMGGTKTMRAAATKWLPKEPGETVDAYQGRLNRSTFYNAYRKSVNMLVGKVFAKEPTSSDDMDQDLQDWHTDIDKEGTSMRVFYHDVFRTAVADGIVHLLVDMPKRPGGWVSVIDEKNLGLRPYVKKIDHRNVLGWRYTTEFGSKILTQIRILENLFVPDGPYGEKQVRRVRVFNRIFDTVTMKPIVNWELWELVSQSGVAMPSTMEWRQVDQGQCSTTRIPIVTLYTGKTGFLCAEPPLMDLAYLNVHHWNSSSDQNHILHVARVPILFGKAFPELNSDGTQAGKVEIGPNRLVTSESENADLKFVEHTGKAIDAGRQDLQDTENRMAIVGAELMAKRTVRITATEQMHDAQAEDSELATMVYDLDAAANEVSRLMCEWTSKDPSTAGTFSFNKDFDADLRDAADLQLLMQAVVAGKLSQLTFISELVRRGVLRSTVDPEDEVEAAKAEAPSFDITSGDIKTPEDELNGGKGGGISN